MTDQSWFVDVSALALVDSAASGARRTVQALTGAVLTQFTYDAQRRLTTLTDGDGNVTTVERDAQGAPTAIVAPDGQRTLLSLDANGYLASLTNPAADATQFTYTPTGLLTTMTTPRGHLTQFAYEALGRLTRDDDPAGGSQALTRTVNGSIVTTSPTTALTRNSTYLVEDLPTGGSRQPPQIPSASSQRRSPTTGE